MSMIKKSREYYEENREPRKLRIRRSSRNIKIEEQYKKIYNMEEHILYRKEEIRNIHKLYEYYKVCDEVMYWLGRKCRVYNKESLYEMLEIYLVGNIKPYEKEDSKKIMEYRLNLKDKNLTRGEIYICHCLSLHDNYSYMMLTNV